MNHDSEPRSLQGEFLSGVSDLISVADDDEGLSVSMSAIEEAE